MWNIYNTSSILLMLNSFYLGLGYECVHIGNMIITLLEFRKILDLLFTIIYWANIITHDTFFQSGFSYNHNIYLNRFNNTKQYIYSADIAVIKFVIKYTSRKNQNTKVNLGCMTNIIRLSFAFVNYESLFHRNWHGILNVYL